MTLPQVRTSHAWHQFPFSFLLYAQVLLGPGAQWKSVKEALPPSKFTYVHGQCGSVGVGGFLLGGGVNPATSARYGFGADNVDEYTVVTANGSIVKVRRDKKIHNYRLVQLDFTPEIDKLYVLFER